MHPPIEFMFAPYENGVQYAGISLRNFLVEVHANWSNKSREGLQGGQRELINEPHATFYSMLKQLELDPETQRRLRRMRAYLPFLQNINYWQSDALIEQLRTALPFHGTYMYEGHSLRLQDLRRDIPAWAAITVLYELLLRTNYWQERGERWAGIAYDPDTLGLLGDKEINPKRVRDQTQAFRRELEARDESKFAFHPLDVMARIFDPYYFERLLEIDLVDLTDVQVARQAF